MNKTTELGLSGGEAGGIVIAVLGLMRAAMATNEPDARVMLKRVRILREANQVNLDAGKAWVLHWTTATS